MSTEAERLEKARKLVDTRSKIGWAETCIQQDERIQILQEEHSRLRTEIAYLRSLRIDGAVLGSYCGRAR